MRLPTLPTRFVIAAGLAGCALSSSVVYYGVGALPPLPPTPVRLAWQLVPRSSERTAQAGTGGHATRHRVATDARTAPSLAPAEGWVMDWRWTEPESSADLLARANALKALVASTGTGAPGDVLADDGAALPQAWPWADQSPFFGQFGPLSSGLGVTTGATGGGLGVAGGGGGGLGGGSFGGGDQSSLAAAASGGTSTDDVADDIGSVPQGPGPAPAPTGRDGGPSGTNPSVRVSPPYGGDESIPGGPSRGGNPPPGGGSGWTPNSKPVAVPEPGSMWLIGTGALVGLRMLKRRQ